MESAAATSATSATCEVLQPVTPSPQPSFGGEAGSDGGDEDAEDVADRERVAGDEGEVERAADGSRRKQFDVGAFVSLSGVAGKENVAELEVELAKYRFGEFSMVLLHIFVGHFVMEL